MFLLSIWNGFLCVVLEDSPPENSCAVLNVPVQFALCPEQKSGQLERHPLPLHSIPIDHKTSIRYTHLCYISSRKIRINIYCVLASCIIFISLSCTSHPKNKAQIILKNHTKIFFSLCINSHIIFTFFHYCVCKLKTAN